MSPVAAPAIGGRPRAATGGFPYPHRTVAEVEAEARRKRPTLREKTVARRQEHRIAQRRKG
jgi:hypothetical protein